MVDQPRRALLSVSDKTGIETLGGALVARGFELISTGGTAAALRAAGLEVADVGALTGYGEFLDGRVKTLHPAVHGGILARTDDPRHQGELEERGIAPFAIVVVNLYPFRETVAAGAAKADVVEMIDIGGPAMIRAAAKNFASVAVVTDPVDYDALLAFLDDERRGDGSFRRRMAAKAFAHTAAYDTAVANWFQRDEEPTLPASLLIAAERVNLCRYGENPHQGAAVYRIDSGGTGVVGARVLQGKALSYNNLADADAAWTLVSDLDRPACAIIKHANPCGVALSPRLAQAYQSAVACDPTSAFGGIVAFNRPLDGATAEAILQRFTEVVLAPGVDDDAATLLATKAALRVLVMGEARGPERLLRSVGGGLLVQEADVAVPTPEGLHVVSERPPTPAEIADLVFAQAVCKHVKSNAIVLARDGATVGVGAGQMSRVDSVRIAARKAQDGPGAKPCVVASDAFFPFPDGLEAAVGAGATAVIQPGGSQRDADVIAAADRLGAAMVFTGTRHFRH
ncbi:MAG: bifunctional phosphoribosylaminoimidazolecarboxamide formyltransferase/IMP cyclohydrolase [Pseudomonadota bacterium]